MGAEETPEMIIAHSILQNNCIYTLKETDEICLYDGGMFHRGKSALADVRKKITDIAEVLDFGTTKKPNPYKCTIAKRNEIIELIKTNSFCCLKEFDKEQNRINIKNGHLILKRDNTGKVKKPLEWMFIQHFKHDEHPYKSFIQLPITYDPNAECLEIDQFLTDIFGFQRVPNVYEMIAYFLMPTIKYQKAFILYGPEDTGKTSVINLIFQFIGGEEWWHTISQVRLQDLGKRFQLPNLRGKLLNIFDDLRENKVMYMDVFRIAVTNTYLRAEKKGVTEYIAWRNTAKQLYACNTLPKIEKNVGNEWWRRWYLFDCFHQFKGNEKDPEIIEKKWPEKELSGLLNQCLKAWIRLEERGHFQNDNVEKIKGLWQMDINPVKLFVDEKCDFSQEYEADYNTFWREVNTFRKEKNAQLISKKMCTQSLQRIKDYVEVKKRGDGSKYYKGVKLLYTPAIELDGKLKLDKFISDVDYSDAERYL